MRVAVVVAKIVKTKTTKTRGVKVTLSGYRVEDGDVKMETTPKVTLGYASTKEAEADGLIIGVGFMLTLKQATTTLPIAINEEVREMIQDLKDDGVEIEVTSS